MIIYNIFVYNNKYLIAEMRCSKSQKLILIPSFSFHPSCRMINAKTSTLEPSDLQQQTTLCGPRRNPLLTFLSLLKLLFHFPLHGCYFLKNWSIFENVGKGNEPYAASS